MGVITGREMGMEWFSWVGALVGWVRWLVGLVGWLVGYDSAVGLVLGFVGLFVEWMVVAGGGLP